MLKKIFLCISLLFLGFLQVNAECIPSWKPLPWSECENGKRTRFSYDSKYCLKEIMNQEFENCNDTKASVIVKANNSDGLIVIKEGEPLTINWSYSGPSDNMKCYSEIGGRVNWLEGLSGNIIDTHNLVYNDFSVDYKINCGKCKINNCYSVSQLIDVVSDNVVVSFSKQNYASVDLKIVKDNVELDGPVTVGVGSLLNFVWTASNVTKCTASGAWSGAKPILTKNSENTTASYKINSQVYDLTCARSSDGSLVKDQIEVRTEPNPPSSDSIKVDLKVRLGDNISDESITIKKGNYASIIWSTGSNVSSCNATGNWSGIKQVMRSCSPKNFTYNGKSFYACEEKIGPITSDGIYNISCNSYNTSIVSTDSVKINVSVPIVDMKVDNSDGPINASVGGSAKISWTSNDPTTSPTIKTVCTASGDWQGQKSLSGSESTGYFTSAKDYIYKLSCNGAGGLAEDSVTIKVACDASKQSCGVCTPNWQPGAWSVCKISSGQYIGKQTREYVDFNNCGITMNKPADESQECTANCTPNWACGSWSKCNNTFLNSKGKQTRHCEAQGCNIYNVSGKDEERDCCVSSWVKYPEYCELGQTQTYRIVDVNKCPETTENLATKPSSSGDKCSTYKSVCQESDNGRDYAVKGKAIAEWKIPTGDNILSDNCIDSKTLMEYYCDNGYLKNEKVKCANNCQNGACQIPAGNNVSGLFDGDSTCFDTDGSDYYNAGKVIFGGVFGTTEYKDICSEDRTNNPLTITDHGKLIEYRCVDGNVISSSQSCPNGCLNGACNRNIGAPSCYDPDGGINPIENTVVTQNGRTLSNDYCKSSKILHEFYCNSSGVVTEKAITCNYSCEYGACKNSCTPNWQPLQSECGVDGYRTIKYIDKNDCDIVSEKPKDKIESCVAPTTSICSETDDGKDFFKKGITTDDKFTSTDYCFSNPDQVQWLAENYCENGIGKFEWKFCDNGCENGACISDQGSTCISNWKLSPGSTCINGKKYILYYDDNKCITPTEKPADYGTVVDCVEDFAPRPIGPQSPVVCNEKWIPTEWSNCINLKKTRSYIDKNDCGTTVNKPKDEVTSCFSKCSDTDGGSDFYNSGVVSFSSTIFKDRCNSSTELIEFYCYNDLAKFIKTRCQAGCNYAKGICNK